MLLDDFIQMCKISYWVTVGLQNLDGILIGEKEKSENETEK